MSESIYTLGPKKQEFVVPNFTEPEHFQLDNGMDVYAILSDQTETLKIEWVFEAGSTLAQKALQASACADLLNKGTHKKTGFEINEQLDLYGSYFTADSSRDHITLGLFTLRRFLPQVLPLVAELFKEAIFPEDEFEVWLDARKNAFQVNNQKTDYVASARFPSVLFGENSAYGLYIKPEHFERITVEDARAHHQCLLSSPCKIFVSGNVPNDWRMLLHHYFADLKPGSHTAQNPIDPKFTSASEHFILVEGAVQHSMIIGKKLWLRDVESYTPFMVMNTLLGGYFGSRLMSNLREKNGFTYGVGSGMSRMQYADMFKISTDVGAEVSEAALREINHEINALQQDIATEEELNRVKTYMGGSFLRSFDGPQAIMDRYKSLLLFGLPLDFFKQYAAGIKEVTAQQVRETAQIHVVDLKTVLSGSKNN